MFAAACPVSIAYVNVDTILSLITAYPRVLGRIQICTSIIRSDQAEAMQNYVNSARYIPEFIAMNGVLLTQRQCGYLNSLCYF